ncbi:MAG: hypothetical protein GXY55_05035 [Phycisphaerae bacterium]|nr:hypothetical protein [Phycisphaerae bacterium]
MSHEVIASPTIPAHLPPRLAIGFWGYWWLTNSGPGEAYEDLERAVAESKDRHFNCLRIDVAPDWCRDPQGRRRGRIELAPFAGPFGRTNNRSCEYRGVTLDVHERLMQLVDLAARYDMCLALTSWQFQETPPIAADRDIRRQILSVPDTDWFMHMARTHDRLINEIKDRGLERTIAYVEVHNEMNYVPGEDEAKRLRSEEAIDFLRQRHPDLLIAADYAWFEDSWFARNTQLVDHHAYAGKSTLSKLFCGALWDIDKGPDMNDEFLRWILKPDFTPWEEFVARVNVGDFVHPAWICRVWFYANLDNNRFDYWCFRQFGAEADGMVESVTTKIKQGADWARRYNVPAVIDEGYNLYPPLHSRFEESAAGRWVVENAVHTAIEQGYWGILPTCYFCPDAPAWHEEPQKSYITKLNRHILAGKVERLLGP